jgi:hypothetical protein
MMNKLTKKADLLRMVYEVSYAYAALLLLAGIFLAYSASEYSRYGDGIAVILTGLFFLFLGCSTMLLPYNATLKGMGIERARLHSKEVGEISQFQVDRTNQLRSQRSHVVPGNPTPKKVQLRLLPPIEIDGPDPVFNYGNQSAKTVNG